MVSFVILLQLFIFSGHISLKLPHQLFPELMLHYPIHHQLGIGLNVEFPEEHQVKCRNCGQLIKYRSGTSAMCNHLGSCNKFFLIKKQ
ncbi:hypothetical protein GLYMA_11G171146v4 [Glycine max]|nr:hypothetical protein GLYMA_11G171146v4 [Glycine max]KAH1115822.1 hypothetical protein GYH30_057112 [Glycine max]